MLNALNELVESRIAEARERGDFNELPGQGKPLEFDDDALVPEEIRAAYRILKNAGFVPPEVSKLREAAGLRAALVSACDELAAGGRQVDAVRTRQLQRRLIAVTAALDAHGIDLSVAVGGVYYHQALDKLAGQPD